MDPFSALALGVVVAAAVLYALYWVIRRAVAAGIADAQLQQHARAARAEVGDGRLDR